MKWYNKGLSLYSGLFDLAVHTGNIISPKMGWYAYKEDIDAIDWDGKFEKDEKKKDIVKCPKGWVTGKRKKDFNSSNEQLWTSILNAGFSEALFEMFSYQSTVDGGVFDDSELEEESSELTELTESKE